MTILADSRFRVCWTTDERPDARLGGRKRRLAAWIKWDVWRGYTKGLANVGHDPFRLEVPGPSARPQFPTVSNIQATSKELEPDFLQQPTLALDTQEKTTRPSHWRNMEGRKR